MTMNEESPKYQYCAGCYGYTDRHADMGPGYTHSHPLTPSSEAERCPGCGHAEHVDPKKRCQADMGHRFCNCLEGVTFLAPQAPSVCPKCQGRGFPLTADLQRSFYNCDKCEGTGTVPTPQVDTKEGPYTGWEVVGDWPRDRARNGGDSRVLFQDLTPTIQAALNSAAGRKDLEGELKAVMADRNKKNIQFAQHVTELEDSLKSERSKWEELERWLCGPSPDRLTAREVHAKLAELRSQKP